MLLVDLDWVQKSIHLTLPTIKVDVANGVSESESSLNVA